LGCLCQIKISCAAWAIVCIEIIILTSVGPATICRGRGLRKVPDFEVEGRVEVAGTLAGGLETT
jgi:hypothetical protein